MVDSISLFCPTVHFQKTGYVEFDTELERMINDINASNISFFGSRNRNLEDAIRNDIQKTHFPIKVQIDFVIDIECELIGFTIFDKNKNSNVRLYHYLRTWMKRMTNEYQYSTLLQKELEDLLYMLRFSYNSTHNMGANVANYKQFVNVFYEYKSFDLFLKKFTTIIRDNYENIDIAMLLEK